MKFKVTYIFAMLFLLAGFAEKTRAQDPDCSNGKIHSIYYMSCFPRQGAETTDDERIQRAINAIPSGKLIFNEGLYTVDNTVNLHGYLTLEGTSTNTLAETSIPTSSHIKMTATNKAIFKIGEGVYDVAIRDLGLSATSRTGTIAILGEGSYPNASALHFEFSNIRFTGFNVAIKVQALDATRNFQFDNVKVDHCVFEGNDTGIYVDSYNSGWQISSIEFYLGSGQIGVDLVNVSYSEINSMIGNGQAPGQTPAYALVRVKEHSNLSINNSISEGVEYDLKVEGISLNYPIFLYNNTFQDKVDISGATVYATANQYGLQYGSDGSPQAPMPVAKNNSRIYSYGEKFCFEGYSTCPNSGWQFQTGAFMISSSNELGNYWSKPSLFENLLRVKTNNPTNPLTDPLVSIIAPTYGGKALLRLGQENFHYTLSRNGTNGWLEFKGNQAAPYTGFTFNGPVKLPTFSQSALPTIIEDGSMVFCSNCQSNNSTCTGGGSGALALSVGGSWVCK